MSSSIARSVRQRGRRRARRLLALCSAIGLLSCSAAFPLGAQTILNPEQTISDADPTDPVVRIFTPGLVYVAFVENGECHLAEGPQFTTGADPFGDGAAGQRRPGIAVSLAGALTVTFEAEDPSPGNSAPEILYRESVMGGFAPAQPLSDDPLPDLDPRVSRQIGFGTRDVVWTRVGAGGLDQVVVSLGFSTPETVAEGGSPDLAALGGTGYDLVYLRDGQAYHRNRSGGVWSAETLVSGAFTGVEGARVGRDGNGAVHVLFRAGGSAWYVRRPSGGGFSAAIEIAPGATDVSETELDVSPGGGVTVFTVHGGDIHRRQGAFGIFGTPENLTNTPADPEDRVACGVDQLGHSHLVYRRAGLLRYRNSVPAPDAALIVQPGAGEVPLDVQFIDDSAGVIDEWEWTLGDGTSSTNPDPLHTYTEPGSYSVTLTVRGPGGEDSITVPDAVSVAAASNVLRVPEIVVLQGQPIVTIPVLATHPDPLQGFQNGLTWDPDFLQFVEVSLAGTATADATPEFIAINPVPGPSGPEGVTLGIVIDTLPPFEGRTLPPGTDQRIVHLVFQVPGSAPAFATSPVLFDSTIGSPPILNIFTVDGVSRVPLLLHGSVTVEPFTIPPPIAFLRGDYDNDLTLSITDAINLLAFLFNSGAAPFCADAADVNDSGSIDLSDPISLLGFLFSDGNAPPYPWPSPGLDPTDDPLGDC